VQRIMQQRLAAFSGEWQAKQQPRLELHASSLWRSNVADRIRLETLLAKLVNEHLPKIQCTVIDSGEARRSKIVSRCESLRVTADQISEIKWLLELTSGPRPLPLWSRHTRRPNAEQDPDRVTGRNTRKHNRPQKRVAQRYAGASSTLPGLSSRRNRSDCRARPARGGSDVDDNNISDDSMGDFIDDDDDVAPVGSVDGDGLATSSRHLASSAPSVDASTFVAELARHSPDAMYLAAIDCILQMAQGATSFGAAPPCGADAAPKDMVPAVIALRVWSEFQCWIHSARPTVKVQYGNFHSRDKAKRQLDHLLAKQQAGVNVEISIKPPRQWVPKRFANVVASVVATPLLHMRAKDCPPHPSPSVDIVPHFTPSLLIDGRHLPEAIHVMHDNGVAQRTAFYNFYCWCRCNDGTHCSPAMPLSKEEGNVVKNAPTMPGGSKGSQLKHKHTHGMVLSSDDNSNNGDSVVDLAILEAEAEHVEQAVQSLQPKAPVTPVTPARNRRRNIRPIREEDAEVLEMRRIQCQAKEEVNCHMLMAAASSPNDQQGAATSQTSVIMPIEVDDDDDDDSSIVMGGDDEIIVSGMMLPAIASTVEVDIGKIGSPTLINTGHFDDQSDIIIPGFIAAQLKPHQLQGIRFMWRNLVMLSNHQSSTGDKGTSKSGRLIPAQHGCILAHLMGLGKTLQTITLIYMLLNAVSALTPIPDFVGSNFNMRRVLILCLPTI
ncbi:hypothetical protein FBU31_003551, partial [Coemansia sp. 'formosensis']